MGGTNMWGGQLFDNLVSVFIEAERVHQYSHNFLVGACTGLYKPVQALKVESLQEKQAMSDFPQVWFHFAQQALIGSLRIICVIRSSFIYFSNMAQDRERAFVCCCCPHRH